MSFYRVEGEVNCFSCIVCRAYVYFVAVLRYVMRSFLSLAFLIPAKAIFVPGMYFFGFSRYSNFAPVSVWAVSPSRRYVPVCSHPSEQLCSCWHRCTRIQEFDRSDDRRCRVALARSCCLRLRRGYDIEHIVSVIVVSITVLDSCDINADLEEGSTLFCVTWET